MRNQFSVEDQRKTALFEAWNGHLENIHSRLSSKQGFVFEEMYEGLAQVTAVGKNSITIRFEETSSVCKFGINEQISVSSSAKDLIYVVAGRAARRWLPLDIISIGTLIEGKEMGFHLTINPLHMQSEAVH